MVDSKFWRELAIEFRTARDPQRPVKAAWSSPSVEWPQGAQRPPRPDGFREGGSWVLAGASEDLFLLLARKAAVALGYELNAETESHWFEHVERETSSLVHVGEGYQRAAEDEPRFHHWIFGMEDLCELSATCCRQLELRAFARENTAVRPLIEQEPQKASELVAPKTAAERKRLVDDYIDRVLDETGERIQRKAIWQRAGYGDPTEFMRWQRCAANTSPGTSGRIMRVLSSRWKKR